MSTHLDRERAAAPPDVPTTPASRWRTPLTPEEIEAQRAIGVRFGTGKPLRDFKPLPQRPRWLAFLITLVFGPG